jgi:branched-chain amino acid transport system substrate-binding protein
MDNMPKWLVWVFGLIVLAALGWMLFGSQEENQEVVKIGFIGALTGDGAPIGEAARNAAMIAIDEINAEGGQQYEVIYEDGKCSGPTSASAAQKLISVDKVQLIIGGMCSSETLGAAPIAEEAKIVLLSPVSSSPDITKAGDYVFRTFASDATSGTKIAETIWSRGLKKIAVISEQTDYSLALKNVFEARYKELGGEVLISEGYASATKDFRSQLSKIRATNPEAIYLVPQTPASGEILLAQLNESGLTVPRFSNELVTTPSLLDSGLSDGIVFAEVNFNTEAPGARMFIDKYTSRFGELSPNSPPIYAASTYDAVYLLTDLITEHGVNPDRIKNALYKVKDRPGTVGKLTIDANGDALREYILKQVANGTIVPVEN